MGDDANELHVPIQPSVAQKLGNPRCMFVTGGPREYLPGLNCISNRLQQLRSAHPLLVMVEPEDETFMRRHVMLNQHPSSAVLPWRRFPDPANRSNPWRYRSAHVMDKMNLFGMPFRRLVWIDADVFIRRNVDELCDLPDDVPFASSLDAEGKPLHCWPKRGSCPGTCSRDYNLSHDSHAYVGTPASQLSPPPSRCPYIIQSGVMVVNPLNQSAFHEQIVNPMRNGSVHTYDSGDQGIISTLLYGPARLFGDSYWRLHPLYNVIARHAKHTEKHWGNTQLTAALLHFTRETRPWQTAPQQNNVTRVAEWTRTCGAVVCRGLSGRQSGAGGANAQHKTPVSIGIHEKWREYCGTGGDSLASASASPWQHHDHNTISRSGPGNETDWHAHASSLRAVHGRQSRPAELPPLYDNTRKYGAAPDSTVPASSPVRHSEALHDVVSAKLRDYARVAELASRLQGTESIRHNHHMHRDSVQSLRDPHS